MTAADGNVTNELLTALATASNARKIAALKVLQGVADVAVNPVSGPLLFSMGKAALFLGVGRSTLWRMLKAGRLEKIEVLPGCFRVRRDDLETIASPHKKVVA